MATGFLPAVANNILNLIFRGVAYTPPTSYYVKLHTGDPGAAGTANPAGNTTRKVSTFGSTATGGVLSNTAAVTWIESEVTTAETYSHFSLWDAATAGNCFGTGTFPAPRTVSVGALFSIPIGDLDISLNVAA